MSYGAAPALQTAIHERLTADPALAALVGAAIFDSPPPGPLPDLYVSLGPEEVRAGADATAGGAWHRITVSVIARAGSFHVAKQAAVAVSDALSEAPLPLARGRLAGLHFFRARAGRAARGSLRRIDLTFRARIDDAG